MGPPGRQEAGPGVIVRRPGGTGLKFGGRPVHRRAAARRVSPRVSSEQPATPSAHRSVSIAIDFGEQPEPGQARTFGLVLDVHPIETSCVFPDPVGAMSMTKERKEMVGGLAASLAVGVLIDLVPGAMVRVRPARLQGVPGERPDVDDLSGLLGPGVHRRSECPVCSGRGRADKSVGSAGSGRSRDRPEVVSNGHKGAAGVPPRSVGVDAGRSLSVPASTGSGAVSLAISARDSSGPVTVSPDSHAVDDHRSDAARGYAVRRSMGSEPDLPSTTDPRTVPESVRPGVVNPDRCVLPGRLAGPVCG